MCERVIVTLDCSSNPPTVGLLVLNEQYDILSSTHYPVTRLEACDFAAWANRCSIDTDAGISVNSDGWNIGIPVDSLPYVPTPELWYHDSHRKDPREYDRYCKLAQSFHSTKAVG
jgi:hypothetical protein